MLKWNSVRLQIATGVITGQTAPAHDKSTFLTDLPAALGCRPPKMAPQNRDSRRVGYNQQQSEISTRRPCDGESGIADSGFGQHSKRAEELRTHGR